MAIFTYLDRAGAAYVRARLARHEGKAVRAAPRGEILGAELDGISGTVAALRARVAALAALTLRVCRAGRATTSAFSSLLGSWVHILLFRRPFLSVFSAVFAFHFQSLIIPSCYPSRLSMSSS